MSEEIAPTSALKPTPSRSAAVALSFITPGLGLIYVGRLLAGLFVNLFFVLLVLLFVVAVNIFKFFPLFPALVLLGSWMVLSTLAALRSLEIIDAGESIREGAYHHPLLYILIALLTFTAPLAVTANFTWRHLFSVTNVDSLVLYPQAHPGDRLLIDHTMYRSEPPARGDLVAVRTPETGSLSILRVVGVPSDEIEMHGYSLVVNNELTNYSPLDPAWVSNAEVDPDSNLGVWIEHNHDTNYVVSMFPGAETGASVSGLKLGDDAYFVLADNRSAIDDNENPVVEADSRVFGPITREHIEGRPLYIAWSNHPATGSPRWNRIGLPTE